MGGRIVDIAVNPNDQRYTHLVGKKIALPLTEREIPIISFILQDFNYFFIA